MTHGDDDGLVLPPKIAPHQVVIVTAQQDQALADRADQLAKDLQDHRIRARVDHRDHGLGWKLNDAELKGSPVIIALGQKELDSGEVALKIRHSGQKQTMSLDQLASELPTLLETIQAEMLTKARANLAELTSEATDYDQFKQIMQTKRGFIKAFWCEDAACEKTIKDETKATTRCLPFIDDQGNVAEETGSCVRCGNPATHQWLFAQAY
jgi:prolyl-tRNA synthetase